MKSQSFEGGMPADFFALARRAALCSTSRRRARGGRAGARSPLTRLLWLGIGCALLLLAPSESRQAGPTVATASAKAKKAKKSAASAQMAKLLEAQGQGVMQCAVKQALDKGANSVNIDARVTVNNRGQVINVVVTAKVDKGDPKPVRDCIDTLIRAIKFPASEAPLTEIQRDWTIQ